MRNLKRAALLILSVLLFAIPTLVVAAQLPTDPERLILDTQNGPVSISVELALTADDRASGLMHRESMASDHGMLFKFDQTRLILMWMKNTPLPLDMLFLDSTGTVVGIAKDTTPFSESIIPSPAPVRYVLELNAGTAAKRGISVGDKARHRVISK